MSNISNYLYVPPLIVTAILSLRSIRRGWPGGYQYFTLFLFLTLATELLAISWKWWLYRIGGHTVHNLWIYNGLLPFRYLFLFAFFKHLLTEKKIRNSFRFIPAAYLLFSVLNYFFIQKPHHASTYTIICSNLLVIFFSLAFFYQTLHSELPVRLSRTSQTWICLGLFLYHTGTLPLFVFFDYLTQTAPALGNTYLYINDGLNILMNLLFLISFLCKPLYPK